LFICDFLQFSFYLSTSFYTSVCLPVCYGVRINLLPSLSCLSLSSTLFLSPFLFCSPSQGRHNGIFILITLAIDLPVHSTFSSPLSRRHSTHTTTSSKHLYQPSIDTVHTHHYLQYTVPLPSLYLQGTVHTPLHPVHSNSSSSLSTLNSTDITMFSQQYLF
jgi:hypothetical protein